MSVILNLCLFRDRDTPDRHQLAVHHQQCSTTTIVTTRHWSHTSLLPCCTLFFQLNEHALIPSKESKTTEMSGFRHACLSLFRLHHQIDRGGSNPDHGLAYALNAQIKKATGRQANKARKEGMQPCKWWSLMGQGGPEEPSFPCPPTQIKNNMVWKKDGPMGNFPLRFILKVMWSSEVGSWSWCSCSRLHHL